MFKERKICEICNSSNTADILATDFTNEILSSFLKEYYKGKIPEGYFAKMPFIVTKCRDCSFIWQKYVLNNTTSDKLYTTWINPGESLKKKMNAKSKLYQKYAKEAQFISTLFKKNPHEIRVLDFGMGWGYWCLMMKAHGYNVTGFEIAADRIAHAKSNCITALESDEDLYSKEFNFINLEQVLEHVPDPQRLLQKLVATLSAEGIVHIAVPDGSEVENKILSPNWKPEHDAIHPLEHINCFTPQTLIHIARLSGLAPIDTSSTNSLKKIVKKLLGRTPPQSTNIYFKKISSRN